MDYTYSIRVSIPVFFFTKKGVKQRKRNAHVLIKLPIRFAANMDHLEATPFRPPIPTLCCLLFQVRKFVGAGGRPGECFVNYKACVVSNFRNWFFVKVK